MPTARAVLLALAATLPVLADFSYTTTMKPAGGGDPQTIRHYYKGQRMLTDTGNIATILDFDAQTVTVLNKSQKTYSVKPFSAMTGAASGAETTIDVKDTGATQKINGFDAHEVILSMDVNSPQVAKAGMQIKVQMDMWLSKDVPGAAEVSAFYKKNAEHFPWAAMANSGNPAMQKTMADAQRKIASMGGVPVLQVVTSKSTAAHEMNPEQAARMEQGRARLEAMANSGGPQADYAKQALARMAGVSSTGGGFSMTMESSGFSADAVPDETFAIPSGYQKAAN